MIWETISVGTLLYMLDGKRLGCGSIRIVGRCFSRNVSRIESFMELCII